MAATQLENSISPLEDGSGVGAIRAVAEDDRAQQAKTLIHALNLISRNLPLPPEVSVAVSSIYHNQRVDLGGEEDILVCPLHSLSIFYHLYHFCWNSTCF